METDQGAQPVDRCLWKIPDALAGELDVLRLMVEESNYGAIAQQLVISPNTVKRHVKHIYDKLAVSSRREAIIRAHALGLFA